MGEVLLEEIDARPGRGLLALCRRIHGEGVHRPRANVEVRTSGADCRAPEVLVPLGM